MEKTRMGIRQAENSSVQSRDAMVRDHRRDNHRDIVVVAVDVK